MSRHTAQQIIQNPHEFIRMRRDWSIRRFNPLPGVVSDDVARRYLDILNNVADKENVSRLDLLAFEKEWLSKLSANDAKYAPYDISRMDHNLLLNEGITVALNLIGGIAATAFSNANAYLGVGDSATAAAATDTGLIATTNELYVAMETSYPSVTNQTITWRSVFGTAQANFAWNEFTVANGNSDASSNLNRLVSAQGTKASGQTWTLDLDITLS